jgi:hypothetical protein
MAMAQDPIGMTEAERAALRAGVERHPYMASRRRAIETKMKCLKREAKVTGVVGALVLAGLGVYKMLTR